MIRDEPFFAALDKMFAAQPAPAPQEIAPRLPGPAAAALIMRFESCAKKRPDGRFEAYPDPGTGGAPWTIGWGSTGSDIRAGTIWTREQCDDRLAADLARFAGEVDRAIGASPTSQSQFDALVSFHYNTGAIFKASLTRLHKAGQFGDAAAEFARWNRAAGKVLGGLTRHRQAEATLYRAG